jgi:hypothetical protein
MRRQRAVSIIEYSLLVAVAALAIMNMSTYVKRGTQGRLKEMTDNFIGLGQSEDASTGEASSRQDVESRHSERLRMAGAGKSSLSLAEMRSVISHSATRDQNAPFLADFIGEEAGHTLPPNYTNGTQMESSQQLPSFNEEDQSAMGDLIANLTRAEKDGQDPGQPGYYEARVNFDKITNLAVARQQRQVLQERIAALSNAIREKRQIARDTMTEANSIRCPSRKKWLCLQKKEEMRQMSRKLSAEADREAESLRTGEIADLSRLDQMIRDMEGGLSKEDNEALNRLEDELSDRPRGANNEA